MSASEELEELRRRVDALERENQRLRESLAPFANLDNPAFNPRQFQKTLSRVVLLMMLPMQVVCVSMPLLFALVPATRSVSVAGQPLVNTVSGPSRARGLGLGFIAFGGIAIGGVAVGGFSFGVVALGGGAVGVLAFGGGSIGVVALGGGSVGIIAFGGGACGLYVLAQKGAGRHVFAMNRQDCEAVEFFCRWLPSLKKSITLPMPVIPLEGGRPASLQLDAQRD